MQKAVDVVASGVGPVETALQVIKKVAGVTGTAKDLGPDISVDEMNQHLESMNASVDTFKQHADQIRPQS